MGVDTQRYIRNPLYVDAVRVTSANFDQIVEWCQGQVEYEELKNGVIKKYIRVRVHQPKSARQSKAFVDDWILYTERGYKVYTNKAFHAAFNEVTEEGNSASPQPRSVGPNVEIRNMQRVSKTEEIPKFYFDPESDELTETKPHGNAQPLTLTELTNIVRNELVGAELHEPIELVPATPESIAQVVQEMEEVRENEEPIPEQPPQVAAAGKRVLSEQEQRELGTDEVLRLIRAGEAVLAQDLETEVH